MKFFREQWSSLTLIPLDLEWMTTITEDVEESRISSVWSIRSWSSIPLDSSWEFSLLCLAWRIKKKSSREDTKDERLQCLQESLSSFHSLVTVVWVTQNQQQKQDRHLFCQEPWLYYLYYNNLSFTLFLFSFPRLLDRKSSSLFPTSFLFSLVWYIIFWME